MDLLTFAKTQLPKSLLTPMARRLKSKPTVDPVCAKEFVRLRAELDGLKGGARRHAFTQFIKKWKSNPSVSGHDEIVMALNTIDDGCSLIAREIDAPTAHKSAQRVETYTLSAVLKYLSEHTCEFIALSQCFHGDVSSSWMDLGLDSLCCLETTETKSGYWIGFPAISRDTVLEMLRAVGDSQPVAPSTEQGETLPDLDPAVEAMLDATLSGAGVPKYSAIRQQLVELGEQATEAAGTGGINITFGEVSHTSTSDEVPSLEGPELKTLGDLGLPTKTNLSVPCLTWSFDHPSVPSASEGYVFRADLVDKLAYALSLNEKLWLTGHTGTGKSSLIDEFAARTNWPVVRINFDGEVGRMDLIGREVLRQEEGTTVSQFVDGIIPQAMQQPCILLLDEIDFVRPEVSYVLQRILENDGALVLTEDGGRIVEPHPLFRIVATSNTKGQGDETGHYTGARSQSAAFLDRFTVWGEVPYLESTDLYPAIEAMGVSRPEANSLADYYHEHVQAFINNSIHLPITPRGMMAWAKMLVATNDLRTSFDATILNRGNEADQSVMKGVLDRVVG